MTRGPFLFALMPRRCFYGFSEDFFFFAVPLSRKRKAVHDRLPMNGTSRPHGRQTGKNDLSARPNEFGQTDKPYFLAGGLPGFTLPAVFPFSLSFLLFVDFSLKFSLESASTSVYLHFRAFQWAASGSHFRSGRKGNSGIGRESKVKPPVFGKNLQPCG